MNILILSAGTRNKIIQYFKENLTDKDGNRTGKVVATDMQNVAPAIYEADKFYIVPRITAPGYIELILDICKKEKIDGVLSLIDPELSLLAEHEAEFKEIGTTVIGSDYEVCEMSLDKMRMYEFCKDNDFNAAKTWNDKELFYRALENKEVAFPVFVKPKCGSASIAINKVDDRETIDLLFKHSDNLIIQELLDGQEIGADCYIDMISGELISVFLKKKLLMRAGETDKSLSFKDGKLLEYIKFFVKKVGYRGQIDIDIFEINGDYYISEVNPRFGGGYPHAYESGANHMKLILNNLRGEVNKPCLGEYIEGTYMMKYSEIMIKDEGALKNA